MIRLSLLPGIELIDAAGRQIDPVLRQPKRLAVLAYLALAGRGALRQRDAVVALFWPEATARRARQALNATTHFLRQHLGATAIVSRGPGEIGLSPDLIWCDAAMFQGTVEEDPAVALRLYHGDLLAGLFIDAGPEFDHWLAGERRTLREHAAAAARRLAACAEHEGQVEDALDWARRRFDLSDNNETAVQDVLALMGRVGERAGALELYERFATHLAQEYHGTRPSAETRALIEAIRAAPISASGIRTSGHIGPADIVSVNEPMPAQTAPLNVAGSAGAASELPSAVSPRPAPVAANSPSRGRRLPQPVTVTAAAFLVVVVGFALWLVTGRSEAASADESMLQHPRIAIEPFATPDTSSASRQFAAALNVALVHRLAQVTSFDVVTPGGPLSSRENTLPRAAVPGTVQLRGDVTRLGPKIRINLRLTDAASGAVMKAAEFDGRADGSLALVDVLSERISATVRIAIGHQLKMQRVSAGVGDPRLAALMQDADTDRQRAAELERAGDIQAAARTLALADATVARVERAAPTDANVRLVRSDVLGALAATYLIPPRRDPARLQLLLQRSVDEAARAMAIDDTSTIASEAFGTMSYMYVSLVPLSEDSATAVMVHAQRALRRVVAADPHRAAAWTVLSGLLYSRADYTGAYAAALHAYDVDAFAEYSQELLGRLFLTAYEIGDDVAVSRWCDRMAQRFVQSWTAAYCQLSVLAWLAPRTRRAVADAWIVADSGIRAADADPLTEPRLHMLVAEVLARAGMRDSAAAVVQRAHARGSGDTELAPFEAEARLQLGDRAAAAALLRRYVAEAPSRRAGVLRSRRFAALRSEGSF